MARALAPRVAIWFPRAASGAGEHVRLWGQGPEAGPEDLRHAPTGSGLAFLAGF